MTAKGVNRNTIINYLSLLLVLVFIFQVSVRTVYTHSHRLADGRIITHTHIFNKQQDSDPLKSHSHTDKQILQLASFELEYFRPLTDAHIIQVLEWTEIIKNPVIHPTLDFQLVIKGRSPPGVSFL